MLSLYQRQLIFLTRNLEILYVNSKQIEQHIAISSVKLTPHDDNGDPKIPDHHRGRIFRTIFQLDVTLGKYHFIQTFHSIFSCILDTMDYLR